MIIRKKISRNEISRASAEQNAAAEEFRDMEAKLSASERCCTRAQLSSSSVCELSVLDAQHQGELCGSHCMACDFHLDAAALQTGQQAWV